MNDMYTPILAEVRTHGVGFYKFNAEEEVRQAQMEQLQNLRDQVGKCLTI